MILRVLCVVSTFVAGGALADEPAPGAAVPSGAAAAMPGRAGPIAIGQPWDAIDVAIRERRYKVEAIRFKARDESGVDWLGSDEVRVFTADAKGFTSSDEIGDIDSGDTHVFDPAASCIIGVRPGLVTLGVDSVCEAAGVPGPFSFRVELWEQDAFFDPFGFGACVVVPPGPDEHNQRECANDEMGDDFLGGLDVFFPVPDLEATLPNVGDSFTETVVLSPCEHGACAGWLLPDYAFTYRTTRLPDVGTDFRSELVAAMRRSRIERADEAIAAGLRLLTTPPPRQAEPEPAPPTVTAGR